LEWARSRRPTESRNERAVPARDRQVPLPMRERPVPAPERGQRVQTVLELPVPRVVTMAPLPPARLLPALVSPERG